MRNLFWERGGMILRGGGLLCMRNRGRVLPFRAWGPGWVLRFQLYFCVRRKTRVSCSKSPTPPPPHVAPSSNLKESEWSKGRSLFQPSMPSVWASTFEKDDPIRASSGRLVEAGWFIRLLNIRKNLIPCLSIVTIINPRKGNEFWTHPIRSNLRHRCDRCNFLYVRFLYAKILYHRFLKGSLDLI